MGYMHSQFRKVEPALVEQRQAPRQAVSLQRATVRRHSKLPEQTCLVDLSIYGCRMLVDQRYKAGDRLWLRLNEGAPIAATAIWCEGGKLGCRFDAPIDRTLFRALTRGGE